MELCAGVDAANWISGAVLTLPDGEGLPVLWMELSALVVWKTGDEKIDQRFLQLLS
jgi:hypothetical protein